MSVSEIIINLLISIVGGIIGAILTVLIINFYNKFHLRKMLLRDRSFTDVLDELRVGTSMFIGVAKPILKYYNDISWFNYPYKDSPAEPRTLENFDARMGATQEFYVENACCISDTINRVILSPQNNVIFEMTDKTFGILNNFKLIGIVNNLKGAMQAFHPIKENYIPNREDLEADLLIYGILEFITYFYDLIDYFHLRTEYDKMHFESEARLEKLFKDIKEPTH